MSSTNEAHSHYSVMLAESVAGLEIDPDGIYIDCTFGRGGHSRVILQQLSEKGQLLAIDQDPEAIAFANQHFKEPQFSIQYGSFEELASYCEARG